MCGKAIKYGETVCSDKCQEEYEKYVKKRKTYIYIMYIALAFLLVMMFLQIM